jgi:hypothetical protein
MPLHTAGVSNMPWDAVMDKWKSGSLKSGNKETGKPVKSQKQAVAIMLSEKRAAEGGKAEYKPKVKGLGRKNG